jgi:TetR/AcrR family transcriptional regulator, mexCD-oprJ operon repressor
MSLGSAGMRSDAIRNREAVLETGLALLGQDPTLSIQEVAAASGLGRSTIYRHFADREELLDAVLGKVIERSRERTSAVPVAGRDAADVIRDLAAVLLDDCFAYGPLIANRSTNSRAIQASRESAESAVRRFIEAASESGDIRNDLPVAWLHIAFQSIPMQALDEVRAGRVTEREAHALVGESLVSILEA